MRPVSLQDALPHSSYEFLTLNCGHDGRLNAVTVWDGILRLQLAFE